MKKNKGKKKKFETKSKLIKKSLSVQKYKKKYIRKSNSFKILQFLYFSIYKIFFIFFLIFIFIKLQDQKIKKENQIKIALCTMGKLENLYVEEYVNYYIKLGVDHLFIYDDNDINTEKISDKINKKTYGKYVTIYENIKDRIINQKVAFTDCYTNNKDLYDWFIMFDMDEYLVIKNNTLKKYLSSPLFNQCDFIRIHWKIATDNNLIYYDNRTLFERFAKNLIKSTFTKSVIRGHIPNLTYGVHHIARSPIRNISCTNKGHILKKKEESRDGIGNINTEMAYIIHFNYKSTEEFVKKYRRGYSNWVSNHNLVLKTKLKEYLRDNKNTKEKIEYIEKELNISIRDIWK